MGVPSWRQEHPPRGKGGPRRGDMEAGSEGPPWRSWGPWGRESLGVRGSAEAGPGTRLQSWAQAGCRYGGEGQGLPGALGRRAGWLSFPPPHSGVQTRLRKRGPIKARCGSSTRSVDHFEQGKPWPEKERSDRGNRRWGRSQARKSDMRAGQGAGGPGVPASASGCPATHVGQGSPWPGRMGRWEGDPGSGTSCRFSQGAERPQTSRAKWRNCPGWEHPEDGRTRRESQRGSGGRWAPLSGRDSAWVTKLRQEKRAGAHVGLAGLPRAGAKCGLHPGCGTAGRERGPGMPARGWLEAPSPGQPPDPAPGPVELPGPGGGELG